MIAKVFLVVATAAICHAGVLTPVHPTPVVAAPVATRVEEYDPHPQYSYNYNVEDTHTGDSKNHHETREGDVVQGSYSLTEPDGSRRTVEYTADSHNGFNAVVHREAGRHPVPVPVRQVAVAPVAVAPVALQARPIPQYNTVRQYTSAPYRSAGTPYTASYQPQRSSY